MYYLSIFSLCNINNTRPIQSVFISLFPLTTASLKLRRGYYTVARRYEFYFRVAKQYFTISIQLTDLDRLENFRRKLIFLLQDEFHRTTFISYFRTVNEFKAPFKSPDSPVHKAGLSLISIETKVVPCRYREKWLQNRGDPVEHARWFIPSLRTWSNYTFISGKRLVVLSLWHRNRRCSVLPYWRYRAFSLGVKCYVHKSPLSGPKSKIGREKAES